VIFSALKLAILALSMAASPIFALVIVPFLIKALSM